MSRNRHSDSSRRAQPVSARKIDIPVMVVAALTAFFATVFATLLLLRPESDDPKSPMRAASLRTAPPVGAPPPEPATRNEPAPEPKLNPTLRAELEQLGIKCAEGADCYPE